MSRYIQVSDGVIVNVVEWDGVTPCDATVGLTKLDDAVVAGVGYTWDGTTATPPAPRHRVVPQGATGATGQAPPTQVK